MARGKRMNDEPQKSGYSLEDYKKDMQGGNTRDQENTRTNTNTRKKKKKKMNKGLKIFLIVLLVLVIIVGGVLAGSYYYINDKLGKMNKESIDTGAIGIDDSVNSSLSGYRNIALLGIDSRADDYSLGNRSDCIIIASINNNTKSVKLISVYRDTYVNVLEKGTEKLDKITHAYSYGGAQNTLKSLNESMDLNIKEYLTVNFDAVIAAVDELGGVNINIDDSELKYINTYIDATSQSSGISSSHIAGSGKQKLDGVQAVAYSRIRYTAGGDYKRTERMRTVVQAMISKAKTLGVSKLNSFADKILPRVSTNISTSTILSLIPSLASFKNDASIGWPYETKGITLDRWYGVPCTLKSNVVKLHKDVFGQSNYTVSNNVETMNNAIIKKTGYKESSTK